MKLTSIKLIEVEKKSEADTSVPLIRLLINHSCSYSNGKNSSMASLDARQPWLGSCSPKTTPVLYNSDAGSCHPLKYKEEFIHLLTTVLVLPV